MEVFEYYGYPREKTTQEIDVEEFLTSDDASGIYLGGPDGKNLCAVTYGAPRGGRRLVRGIQDGKNVWFIDAEDKTLTRKNGRNVLYDADKITERVIFEGGVEQILSAFEEKGYSRVTPDLPESD